jgi:putative ABC transport system substrate-binding protein
LDRRHALGAFALLGFLAGNGHTQSTKVFRVGVLRPGSAKEPASVQREPFERGLRELGWVPGSNVLIDYRYGEGDAARLPQLAAELVGRSMDVIVATGAPAAHAVRAKNATIPIVMAASSDPVADGLAVNLARPGKNTTGIANFAFEMDGKRLELLKETFPRTGRVALLANPDSGEPEYRVRIGELRQDARRLGVELEVFEITRKEQIAGAFSAIERGRFDALMVRPDPRVFDLARSQIAAAAARLRLPAIYAFRIFPEAGGLMSYGESIPGFHYSAASYVSRILRGANASDLAFERPTKFALVLNLKAAKALGVEFPKATLFRADEVIQ